MSIKEIRLENNPPEGLKLPFKKSHAFIIGINDYCDWPKLRSPVNDANKLAEILETEQGFKVHPPLLNASSEEMKQFLEKTMLEKVGAEDRCLLFYTGHSTVAEDRGYLIPADAGLSDISSYYSMHNLYYVIDRLPCTHFLLILDCSFSGVFKWSTQFRGRDFPETEHFFKKHYNRFVKNPAWQVITSTGSDQRSNDRFPFMSIGKRDHDHLAHSLFAMTLFEGLYGAADIIPAGTGDGLITATELYLYLRDQVENLSIGLNQKMRQTPTIFTFGKHDNGEYIFLNPRHPLNLPPTPEQSPYKGLSPFDENDEHLFYGRKRVLEALMGKIYECNLVVVTGASGCGKSSVVKAGLIPRLRQQGYNIQFIQPGDTPTRILQKALQDLNILHHDISFSNDMDILASEISSTMGVLIIDQYEELVTKCQDKEDRKRFVQLLKILLDVSHNNRFKIILTVCADFLFDNTELLVYPNWKEGIVEVPSPDISELQDIIAAPAKLVIMEFEPPSFIDRLIEDFYRTPGALPLLSLTLDDLFHFYFNSDRVDRSLREEDYKNLMGANSPLYKQVEIIRNTFSDNDHRKTLRKILMRLVSVEEKELVGRKTPLKELEFSKEENCRLAEIVNTLIETRLVVKNVNENMEVYLELAHPALIEIGQTLEDWPKETDKDRILLQNSLAEAAKAFAVAKDKNLLWPHDHRLKLLKQELELPDSWLNQNEISFIKESIRKRSIFVNIFDKVMDKKETPISESPIPFISYSHLDHKFVKRLATDLENSGFNVWLDEKKIKVGDSISKEIEKGISGCDFFCLVISNHSVNSNWVDREYRTALNAQLSPGKKPKILPLLIQNIQLPFLLIDIKYANFSKGYNIGLEELLIALKEQ